MTVGKALLETWKKETRFNTRHSGVVGLEQYLRYNYNERYVALCNRIGLQPVGFGPWLRKDILTIQ